MCWIWDDAQRNLASLPTEGRLPLWRLSEGRDLLSARYNICNNFYFVTKDDGLSSLIYLAAYRSNACFVEEVTSLLWLRLSEASGSCQLMCLGNSYGSGWLYLPLPRSIAAFRLSVSMPPHELLGSDVDQTC
jgi:hypothetical protein